MKRSDRIKRLRDIASLAESRARGRIAVERNRLARADEQKQLLIDYREEYTRRLAEHGGDAISARQLANFQKFVQSLNTAVGQQSARVDAQRAVVAREEMAWRGDYRRVNSLDKAQASIADSEQVARGRKEQRLIDDAATERSARGDQS